MDALDEPAHAWRASHGSRSSSSSLGLKLIPSEEQAPNPLSPLFRFSLGVRRMKRRGGREEERKEGYSFASTNTLSRGECLKGKHGHPGLNQDKQAESKCKNRQRRACKHEFSSAVGKNGERACLIVARANLGGREQKTDNSALNSSCKGKKVFES